MFGGGDFPKDRSTFLIFLVSIEVWDFFILWLVSRVKVESWRD